MPSGCGPVLGSTYGRCRAPGRPAAWLAVSPHSGPVGQRLRKVARERRLRDAIAEADLVITEEGTVDLQSFEAKVVGGVAQLASAAGIPVLVIAGIVTGNIPASVSTVTMTDRFGRRASMEDTLGCIRAIVHERLRR
jgi:glycerate kinase